MFCPYYKNKEVFDGFNEIIEALGGKPLTEDEFRSSELRNLRTGVDYSAMEAAYRMYHRNNGNMPDLAPNGKHSILFDTLLEHFNGDRAKAIRAKSNVYSDKFINWFGDWEKVARKNSNTVQPGETIKIGNIDYTITKTEDAAPLYSKNGLLTFRNIPIIYVKESLGYRTGGYIPSIDAIILSETNSDTKTLKHELVHSIEYSIESSTLNPLYEKVKNNISEDSFDNVVSNNFRKNIHEFIADAVSSDVFRKALEKEGLLNEVDAAINSLLDNNDASKVVDENGEPLVVWHHTNNPNLTKFNINFDNYFAKDGGTKEAIFFDENQTGTLNRKYDIPVFLNIKELNEYNETKQQLHDRGTTYREVVNKSAEKNNKDGGVHMKDFDDNKMEHQSVWIVHNPNQIKSATKNKGTFSRENNDIRMSISNQNNKRRNASSRSISRLLISHMRSSGINVYGRSKMELYLRSYSDVLTLLFIGKKSRDKFKQQLIKARPDLAIPGYSIDGVDFVKGVLSDEQIPVGYIDHATGIKLKKEGIIEEGTYSQWRLTEKGKAKAEAGYPEIDAILNFLHSLDDDKENAVYIKTAIRWIANRSLTLPDDYVKSYQAFELARKKHLDLQKYPTLGALIASPEMLPKEKEKKTFNPDTAKTFSNKRTVTTEGGRVFTVYDVEDTDEGQREVCKALAAHYKMSPWCLSTFTATGEPTLSAKNYWNRYDAIPRKIAYENGKPVAFNSSSRRSDGSTGWFLEGIEVHPEGFDGEPLILYRNIHNQDTVINLENQGLIVQIGAASYKLTEEGKKHLLQKDDKEAWWDMEDRNPREELDDYIVSEQRSMMTGHEEDDLIDFAPEPFEPNPLEIYEMDVLNSARSFLNDYILSYIRVENLVPAGMNEIYVRNYLVDIYLEEGRIRDILETLHLEGTSFEIALDVLSQLNVFNRIGHTIDSHILEMPLPAAPINPNPEPFEDDLIPFFMTPNGEVYGFVTKNGDIYLDDTIISPEHPIHEYTHLWDRIVSKRNPELWQRGIELMKQTSEWNKILNDDNYGKRWKSDSSISETQLEFLIASEVHARLTGEYGELIINNIANKKGSKNIINKLKQWILDFWKDLKSTFSSWSKEDLQKLTVEDFNKMTVRDLVELKQNGNTYGMKRPYISPTIQELNVDLSLDLMANADNTKANEYGDKFGWSVESITNHLKEYIVNSAGVPDIEAKSHVKDINDKYGTNFGVYRKNGVRMLKRNTKPISELKLTENPNGNDGMINKTIGSKFSQYKLDSRKEGFSELMRMLNDDPELYYEYLEYLGKDVESKC